VLIRWTIKATDKRVGKQELDVEQLHLSMEELRAKAALSLQLIEHELASEALGGPYYHDDIDGCQL
jgi:hypothetical protein